MPCSAAPVSCAARTISGHLLLFRDLVKTPSTIQTLESRGFPETGTSIESQYAQSIGAERLEELFYIADRDSIDRATELLSEYGMMAIDEAAARSQRFREIGNAVRFCEWRQIERFLAILSQDIAVGTVH